MMDVDEFRKQNPPEDLEEILPDRPISNLRDIQHLYGLLYDLATPGGGEYGPFLTPDEASDLIGEEESVVAVNVDLSGDEPRLGDPAILVTKYTDERIPEVAHSKYPAARGIDHSITHQSGQDSDPEKLSRYAAERISDWPTKEPVAETAEEHEDGWIIKSLERLGSSEDTLQAIQDAVQSRLGGTPNGAPDCPNPARRRARLPVARPVGCPTGGDEGPEVVETCIERPSRRRLRLVG